MKSRKRHYYIVIHELSKKLLFAKNIEDKCRVTRVGIDPIKCVYMFFLDLFMMQLRFGNIRFTLLCVKGLER